VLPAVEQTPEREFLQKWYYTLVGLALAPLREEYPGVGRGADFALLEPFVLRGGEESTC
jgi:hypothetical protein